jgi:Fanconi anemia group M protein
VKNYSYNFVAQKYISQALNPRIIGLTASPGSDTGKIKQICKNLSIQDVELRSRESPDVAPYLQELEIEKIKVDFPPEMVEMKHVLGRLFEKYVDELRRRKVLWGPSSKTGLIALQKKIINTISRGHKNFNYFLGASACAQAIKIQHALELLETQTLESFNLYLKKLFKEAADKKSKGVIKLVANPEFNYVYVTSNELLAKNREHPKIHKLAEIIASEFSENDSMKIIVFTQFRDSAKSISDTINKISGINSEVFVGQAKRTSGKSTTGLNQKQQQKMLINFSEGDTNVLVATSIAEEGLDIPEVNSVIFYEPIPSAIRKIQRAGRTARLTKGKVIMLITKGTRDETFYYISRAREKSMAKSIETIKQDLSTGKFSTKDKQKTLK